jgi:hypothetical protein
MATLTSAQMQAILNGGGTVGYRNQLLRPGDTAPSDAQIAIDAAIDAAVGPSPAADRAAQHVYSVKDAPFLATGDGATNDSAAILATIAAAPAGSRIIFPAGAYNLGGTVIPITKQLDIVGAGPRNTIIYQTGNVDAFAVNVAAQGGGSRIFNMTIRDMTLLAKTNQSAGAMLHLGSLGTTRLANVTISAGGGGKPYEGVRIEDGANYLCHAVQVASCVNACWHLEPVTSTQQIIDVYWDDECSANSGDQYGILAYNAAGGSSSVEGLHGAPGFTIYNNASDGIHAYSNGGAVKNFHFTGCVIDSNKGVGAWTDANTGLSCTNIYFDSCAFSANSSLGIAPSGPYLPQLYLGRVTNFGINKGNLSLGGTNAIQINGANHGTIDLGNCYNNNQGGAVNVGSDTYAIALLGTTNQVRIFGTMEQDTSRGSDPVQNGLHIASTVTDVSAFFAYKGAGTALNDLTDGTKRIKVGYLDAFGANSDNTMAFRGLNIITKGGGGAMDTLRLTDSTAAKQAYLRCNNGRVEVGNSGFTAVTATLADQNGHRYKMQAAVPTYVVGAAAGTSPTTAAMTGTDESMTATLTTGTATTTGATILTVTFAGAWDAAANNVQVIPKNSAAAATTGAAKPYVTNITTTGFILQSNTTALAISTQYVWGFVVS